MNIYNITMKQSDFFKHSDSIVATAIKIGSKEISFKTDLVTKKYLDDNKISYSLDSKLKDKLFKKIFFNLNLIMFFLIFIMILYINSFRVSKISFNTDYEINSKIEETIKKRYKHFLFFDFISVDFEELSRELRTTYSNYEWIEIYKNGTTIVVNVNNALLNEEDTQAVPGNIVAKCDGIIESFKVYQGKIQVEANQYVKKGDILISGNVNDLYLEARGLVLGYIYEEYNISINKSEENVKASGNSSRYKLFSLFNKLFSFKKKTNYESYKTNKSLIFNFFNFFKVYQIEEIELYDIIVTNTYEDALEKAKNKIKEAFELSKISKEEELLKLELLYSSQTDNEYNFRFLTKKLVSLGEFQSF